MEKNSTGTGTQLSFDPLSLIEAPAAAHLSLTDLMSPVGQKETCSSADTGYRSMLLGRLGTSESL